MKEIIEVLQQETQLNFEKILPIQVSLTVFLSEEVNAASGVGLVTVFFLQPTPLL